MFWWWCWEKTETLPLLLSNCVPGCVIKNESKVMSIESDGELRVYKESFKAITSTLHTFFVRIMSVSP